MGTDDVAEILVVCLGNICRSPFGEVALQEEARRRYGDDAPVRVHSAGVRGLAGQPAPSEMRAEADDRGLDLSSHRGAGVHPTMIAEADLVLAMTESQRDALVRLAPSTAERIFTLKEFARLVGRVEPPTDVGITDRVREVTARAHAMRPRVGQPGSPEDVDDPYGAGRLTYRRIADEIEALVDDIAAALFGSA